MLIAQNLLSVFHFVLKVHNSITTFLYTRPTPDNGRAMGYISLSFKSLQKFNFLCKVSVAYVVALFGQIVHAVKFNGDDNLSLVAVVPSLLFLFSFAFHLPTISEHYKKREEFCPLFNAFLDFERKHNGNSLFNFI